MKLYTMNALSYVISHIKFIFCKIISKWKRNQRVTLRLLLDSFMLYPNGRTETAELLTTEHTSVRIQFPPNRLQK